MSDTSRRALESGPYEPDEWPCQRDGCEDGQIPAGAFYRSSSMPCDECNGEGFVYIDPDDWLDTRDHERDETLLYDDIDFGEGHYA